jgi:RnfABCDGE-type electron transport complex G subunit
MGGLGYLLGGLWMWQRKLITWHVPVSFIGAMVLLSGGLWLVNPAQFASPLFHLLSGGAMLGAFFIATDPVSGSTTPRGKLIFGAGAGLLAYIIRVFGGYPDGVAFAVLLMNLCVPVIDLLTQPRIFGMKDADKEQGMSAAKEFTARAWPSARPASCSSSSFTGLLSLPTQDQAGHRSLGRRGEDETGRRGAAAQRIRQRPADRYRHPAGHARTRPGRPSTLYRARKAGQPVALVFESTAPDGYAGKIRLIVAVRANGEVAVRVTQHKETPGLGDYVEVKDKNKARPWITQFTGLSLAQVSDREWKVKKDGGRFDYYAGATVTPRAVTKAV